jgi:ferric-dicitrate binding protein FerR (iron transport regulator)
MTTERDEKIPGRVARAWQRHAERPTSLSPAEAARQVLSRLPARQARVPLRAWAFAAAAVLVCVGVWIGLRPPTAPGRQALVTPPPLPENVVQWWLDDQTPVYFVLGPADSKGGW